LGTVPAVATDATTVNTWLNQIYVANTTAGALTFTVLDKASSPKTLIPTVSIPANSATLFLFGDSCQFMPGGVTWSCSGAGMTGSIFGYIAG